MARKLPAFGVGIKLRKAREAAGLSQREVAKRMNSTQGTVSIAETTGARVDKEYVAEFMAACRQGPARGAKKAKKAVKAAAKVSKSPKKAAKAKPAKKVPKAKAKPKAAAAPKAKAKAPKKPKAPKTDKTTNGAGEPKGAPTMLAPETPAAP